MELRKKIFGDEETDLLYQKEVKKTFSNYTDWHNNQPLIPKGVNSRFVPGDFSYTFEKNGVALGILGLNTAFLQLTDDKDYEGRLVIGPSQFNDVCHREGPDWVSKHDAYILLTHHPSSWLDAESQRNLNQIKDFDNFAIHLCGHMHETSYSDGIWQGRSLFGLEYFNGSEKRLHGYTIGRIRMEKTRGELLLWPRQLFENSDGRSNIGVDEIIKSEVEHYIRLREFQLRKAVSPSSSKKPSDATIREKREREKRELVELILKIPDIANKDVRDSLLQPLTSIQIPGVKRVKYARTDIGYIVEGILKTGNQEFISTLLNNCIEITDTVDADLNSKFKEIKFRLVSRS
ncbi:MAG: hypothetical protein SVR94_19595 [Pseudomonadota bacterium]|nr:hypothetical protein [Pseudomonadota bacterium]